MRELNISKKYIDWIIICICYVSYKYVVNVQTTSILKAERGLKQGDLISPLLFWLIMEYLHRCL